MSDKALNYFRLNCILLLGVIFLFPLMSVSAEVVWEEDFDDPPFDDWYLQCYESNNNFSEHSGYLPYISNGRLQMPVHTGYYAHWSPAIRNSSVAYGTWAFDWILDDSSEYEHESWDPVFFIADMPLNFTGLSDSVAYCAGYALGLKSGERGSLGNSSAISLFRMQVTDPYFIFLEIYDVPGDYITGSHTIHITRSLTGEFNVYFDSSLIITHTDNTVTTSKRIAFSSWVGDSAFDNIMVDDEVVPPPSDVNFSNIFISLGSSGLLVYIRKKGRR